MERIHSLYFNNNQISNIDEDFFVFLKDHYGSKYFVVNLQKNPLPDNMQEKLSSNEKDYIEYVDEKKWEDSEFYVTKHYVPFGEPIGNEEGNLLNISLS